MNLKDLSFENREFLVDIYVNNEGNFKIEELKIPTYFASDGKIHLYKQWESDLYPPVDDLNKLLDSYRKDYEFCMDEANEQRKLAFNE